MATVSVSLPEGMKEFVDEQVSSGSYETASDYLQALVREAQLRAARAELNSKLLQAVESGPPVPVTQELWDEIERQGRARLSAQTPE